MNDVIFTECKFSADMVPYMYAELSAASSSAFESHLIECGACTDEFAAMSNARYEVYDWKRLEFDPIATPKFAIPFQSESHSVASSWIEKVRTAVSGSWAIPGVAFAGLAIISVLVAVFILSGAHDPEIAANTGALNTGINNLAVGRAPESSGLPVASEPVSEVSPGRPFRSDLESIAKPAPRKPAVRNVKVNTRSYVFTQASAQNEQKEIPRLNEFSEDEDTSLRLAELFDDLDTRN